MSARCLGLALLAGALAVPPLAAQGAGDPVRLALHVRAGDSIVLRVGRRDSTYLINPPADAKPVLVMVHARARGETGSASKDERWLCRSVAADGSVAWSLRWLREAGTSTLPYMATLYWDTESDSSGYVFEPGFHAVGGERELTDFAERVLAEARARLDDEWGLVTSAAGRPLRASLDRLDAELTRPRTRWMMGGLEYVSPPDRPVRRGETWRAADSTRHPVFGGLEVWSAETRLDSVVGDSAWVTTRFEASEDVAEDVMTMIGEQLREQGETPSRTYLHKYWGNARRRTVGTALAVFSLRDGLPLMARTQQRAVTRVDDSALNAPGWVQETTITLVRVPPPVSAALGH